MATKNNPGQFDCYAKAAPDEPIFTLRAKDVSAPYFVTMWSEARQGLWQEMLHTLAFMMEDPDVLALVGPPCDKSWEALDCAIAMRLWKRHHPQPLVVSETGKEA